MLAIEEVLSELNGGDHEVNEQGLPPGFRFHPTDEELITFYLASKVFNGSFCGIEIAEVDLNRCEPWELPGTFHFLQHIYLLYIHAMILLFLLKRFYKLKFKFDGDRCSHKKS